MDDNNSLKIGSGEMEVCYWKVFIWSDIILFEDILWEEIFMFLWFEGL